jgi:iron complex outermembrane recepter protein
MARSARTLFASLLLGFGASALHAQAATEFDLPAQPLAESLKAVGIQAKLNVVSKPSLVDGRQAPALKATVTPHQALTHLLADTGLEYQFVNEQTVVIRSAQASASAPQEVRNNEGQERPLALAQAQAQNGSGPTERTISASDSRSSPPGSGEYVEEILVTAQKRQERLQDVPVPVAVIDAGALAASSQVLLSDYYNRIPNLNLTPGTQSTQVLAIRGITTGRGNPTVGIVIDDMPYGSTFSLGGGQVVPDIDPGDLARIEVLRGPQGTLYGASSMGGLLKFVTVDPSTAGISGRLQGAVTEVEGGADVGYALRGSVNLPLGERAAVRVSGFHRQDPGYIDNIQTDERDVNSADANGARVSLLWEPSQNTAFKLGALFQEIDGDGSSDAHVGLGDLEQRALIGTGWYERKAQAYQATLTTKLGFVDVTSVTGYNVNAYSDSLEQSYSLGLLMPPIFGVNGSSILNDNETKKLTQELRVSVPLGTRTELLAGAFYTDEDSFTTQNVLAQNVTTGAAVGRFLYIDVPTTYSDLAAFANLTLKITDRFDVQVGGRQSWLRQTFEQIQIQARANQPDVTSVTQRLTAEPDVFTYLLTPRFRVSPTLMLYARLASGYRAGGTNAGTGAPLSYAPDETENYELGLKGSFLDQKLSVDASLYHIDWKDIQLLVRPPGALSSFTINGSPAKNRGVEISVDASPWRGFAAQANVVWNDAEVAEDFPASAAPTAFAFEGDRLPWSSRWSGNLSLQQEFPLAAVMSGFVGASVSYVGDREGVFRPAATPLRQHFPSYTKVDVTLGLRTDQWDVSVYANNLADERAPLWGGIGAIPPFGFYYIQPRAIGLSLTRTF